eukprot:398393_1
MVLNRKYPSLVGISKPSSVKNEEEWIETVAEREVIREEIIDIFNRMSIKPTIIEASFQKKSKKKTKAKSKPSNTLSNDILVCNDNSNQDKLKLNLNKKK